MPRKGWRKPKEQPLWDFVLTFSDITLAETEGEFDRVKKLMDEDEALGEHEWCIDSRVSIVSPFGEGMMRLNMYHDRRVFISEYFGPTVNPYLNSDVRCVSQWCQGVGWMAPQVTPAVAKQAINFWKELWKSNIIDSDFLEEKFGKRPFDVKEIEKEEEYEDEEY